MIREKAFGYFMFGERYSMSIENQESSQIIFSENLVELDMLACDYQEAIIQLSRNFLKKKYVKETYTNALIEREKEFPTGLTTTNNIGIAIPHTDPKHVNKGSLAIGVLKKPVKFRAMDTRKELDVSIIFMLAITHPSAQLKMLQKVIEIIRNDQVLINIKKAKSKSEVTNIVKPFLGV